MATQPTMFHCPRCGDATTNGNLGKDGWYHSICADCNISYPTIPDEILYIKFPTQFAQPVKRPKISKWL